MKKLVLAILLCTAVFAFAQNGTTLRYAYEIGKMYNYGLTTQTNMAQEMGGHEMVTEISQNAKLVIAPQSVAEQGNYTCWISFTEMSLKIKNFRMDTTMVMTDLLNKRAEVVHSPLGKVTTAVMIDSISQAGGPMMSQMGIEPAALFKRLLVHLPEKTVVVGATWTETKVDTVVQGGITIAVAPNTTYSALAEEERAGFKCLKIAFKGTLVINGSGSQMGANIVIEGEGTQEGTLFFAPAEGLLVSAESSSSQEQTIAITGPANMTIPQTVSVKSSFSYLP
jgi:hypothetical protein